MKINKPAFSTLEVLLALAVMVVSLSSGILIVFGSQLLVQNSTLAGEALQKTRNLMQASGQSSATISQDGWLTQLSKTNPDSYVQELEATASFGRFEKKDFSLNLNALEVDWQKALVEGSCYFKVGDWASLGLKNFTFDYGPISELKVRGKLLYIILSATALKSQPTFLIFNIASSTNPVLEGSLDNATTTVAGLSALAITGNYAYVASARSISSAGSFGQLQIVDISNPQSPRLMQTYKIPGVAGTSGQGVGNSISLSRNYIYLGLTKTGSGPEFNVVDVSDPQNPKLAGSFAVGSTVNAIVVANGAAFLAHPIDSSSGVPEQLTVVDVSSPNNIFRVGGFHAADNQGNGKSIFLDGDNLFFGRTITNSPNPELVLLNAANLTVGQPLGTAKISNSVNALAVFGQLLFAFTNSQLKILNALDLSELPGPFSVVSPGTSLACSGNTVYASSASTVAGFLSILSE